MIEKSERITVRFTPEAEEWVIAQAEKAGVSKGRYLREVVLCQRPQAQHPFDDKNKIITVSEEIRATELRSVMNQDLSRIGNNLNQLTRHVNQQSKIGVKQTEKISEIRYDLKVITQTIIRALR